MKNKMSMRKQYLQPIKLEEKEIIKIFKSIREYLKDTFYNRVLDIYKSNFNKKIVLNSINVNLIIQLLKNNKLILENNTIKGQFNSKITKELVKMGAVYDKRKKNLLYLIKVCHKNF